MIWQTRTICTYVAATVPVEEGATNQLLEQALEIGQPSDETDSTSVPAAVKNSTPEPQPGSYERFMSSFGSPKRWAGR